MLTYLVAALLYMVFENPVQSVVTTYMSPKPKPKVETNGKEIIKETQENLPATQHHK